METDILPPMVTMFTRNWWTLLLRGIVAVLFGILALSRPGITLAVLIVLFGVYALIDGCFALVAAVSGWSHREDRWLLVLEGAIGVLAGFAALRAPALTTVALMFFIAAWALGTGVLKIVESIRLRREVKGEFWLALSGAASVIFAFMVMLSPLAGALAMAWLIGFYAILLGGMLIMLGLKAHSLHRFGSPSHRMHPRAA
jgi:uncharacterized membrane protein HdeD (DUF308 family)